MTESAASSTGPEESAPRAGGGDGRGVDRTREPVAARVAYAPGRRMPRHAHPHSNVTLVLAGGLEERVGRRTEEAEPLSVVVKPAGTEHANRFGDSGTVTFAVRLPDTFLAELGPAATAFERWRWLRGGPAVAVLLRMRRRLADLPERGGAGAPTNGAPRPTSVLRREALASDLYELVACLYGDARLPRLEPPPGWLDDVRDAFRSDLRGGVRTGELARRVGVHPVYLARRFRRHFGCSVSDYVRRRRCGEAARLLARTDRACSRIALDLGFADQSHFCRDFRRETGTTPTAYRALSRV